MKTISLAQFVGSLIDEYGFNASDIARAALTHETNTVVESPVDSPVEATVTRKKRRTRSTMCTSGAMQPGGEIFNHIKKSFYSFPQQAMTVSDLSKHSGHPMQRVRAVEAYMITQGLLRRDGRKLHILA